MVAIDLPEDLWEKIIVCAEPGKIPAVDQATCAVLRRDSLWKAFAARKPPRLWGALAAAPPGRDRFRRAVLLDSDSSDPAPPPDDALTCIVIVTQEGTEVFRARFPFEPGVEEDDFYGGGAQLNCAVPAPQHGLDSLHCDKNAYPLTPDASKPFSAVTGEASNFSPSPHPDSLTITYLLERADGRIAKLLTFGDSHFSTRDCMSNAGDEGFELMTWYTQRVDGASWKFELVFSVTFPGYGDGGDAFDPEAPWEGLVACFELHASNRAEDAPFDEEESAASVADLRRWVAQLPWR